MYLADAHTHLDFSEFDEDRDDVVLRARSVGVGHWVICGSQHERWSVTDRIAAETGGIPILGVHPWSTAELDAAALAPWLQDLRQRPLRGVGEIGLDTLHGGWENQRRGLRDQLAIARERDLPVVLHCVRAYPELLALVARDGAPRAGGMMHAWSGHPDQVARALSLGLHVSFGPMVLHDRARKARASVPLVPDDRLLVETDCPNMKSPGVTRGEPAHLPRVVAGVAALRGQTEAEIGALTARNLETLFGPVRPGR